MSKSVLKHRSRSFQRQNGHCYYCGMPMWIAHSGIFAAKYKLKGGFIRRLQATAEHLNARQDGGKNSSDNIVAACHFCNTTRHKRPEPLSAVAYKKHVVKRIRKSRWHPKELHHLLG